MYILQHFLSFSAVSVLEKTTSDIINVSRYTNDHLVYHVPNFEDFLKSFFLGFFYSFCTISPFSEICIPFSSFSMFNFVTMESKFSKYWKNKCLSSKLVKNVSVTRSSEGLLRGIHNVEKSVLIFLLLIHFSYWCSITDHAAIVDNQIESLGWMKLQPPSAMKYSIHVYSSHK